MNYKLILIDVITPEFLTEAQDKFKNWIRTRGGYREALDLDTWNTIELDNGGFIDFHLDFYDGELTLEFFPCNTTRSELVGGIEGAVTEMFVDCDCTTSVTIRDDELNKLLPQSFIEYVKEETSHTDEL